MNQNGELAIDQQITNNDYPPQSCVPRDIFQQRAMRTNGGEQRLPRAFSDGWPRVDTQLTKFGIQTHPLPV